MIRNLLLTFLLSFSFYASFAQIIVSDGTTYNQNFSTLISSGTGQAWNNNVTLTGWYLYNSVNSAIALYNSDTGSGNAGSFISYGASANSDRSLGGLGSGGAYFGSPAAGTVAGWIAVSFNNSTGSTINNVTLSFNGEQWRNGGNATAQTMVMQYGFGATFATVPSWITPGGNYDWTSPVATATAAAVDGNVAGLVSGKGGSLTSLNWTSGTILWIRWVENNDLGNDHGLAIDNFSFTPIVAGGCTPPSMQATSFNGSNATISSMDISWIRGNGSGIIVLAKSGSAVDAIPVSGTPYSANSAFGSGDQIGTGNYVVYKGIGTNVSITALTAGTTYHYALFEYNTATNCYLTPALIGNFSTLAAPSASYRSIGSGDWNLPSVWEYSLNNGMSWSAAIGFPSTTDDLVTIRNGNSITTSDSKNIDQLVIENGGSLEILSGQLTVNNGTGTDLDIFGTLINSNANPIVLSSGSAVVVENNGKYIHNVISPNIPLFTWNTGSTCEIQKFAASSLNNTLSQTFYNFYWNNTTQTGETNMAGFLNTINGDFKILSTNGFNLRQIGSAMTLAVSGNFEVCSTCAYNFSGASGQGTIDLKGNLVLNGKLTETSTGSGRIIFSKTTGAQNITFGSSASTDNTINMEINNSNGIVLLSDAFLTGTGTLTFVNGQIRTNGFTYYVASTVTMTGTNSSKYFCTCDATGLNPSTTGGLIMDVNTGATVLHPVGPTSTLYMPATLIASPASNFGNYIVRVEPLGSNGVIPNDATKCIQYQWDIEDLDPSASKELKLKLQWAVGTEGSNFVGGPSLVIGHWNGFKFNVVNSATYAAVDPSALSNTFFNSFSPFVVASEAIALPVNLINFSVTKQGSGVKLEWSTSGEYGHSRFEIERSKNGKSFEYLGVVESNHNSSSINKYNYFDSTPLAGLTYYRLKSIDNNESYIYSEIRTISGNAKNNLNIVNMNNEIHFNGVNSNATIIVYDFSGNVVYKKNVQNDYQIKMYDLPKGALYFTITENGKSGTLKVINL